MDTNEISKRKLIFDDFAHEEEGIEFWYARDIMKPLGYARWENFEEAIKRAIVSCESSKTPVRAHFRDITKMVKSGVASIPRKDYQLTRYACYLIAMNGDTRKPEIAFAQSYFAVETRKNELIEKRMAEIQRIQSRRDLSESEKHLSAVAFDRGVDSKGFAQMKSKGDFALFGGLNTASMKKRLGVPAKSPLADKLPDVTINAKNLANSMTAYNAEHRDLYGTQEISSEHVGNNQSVRQTLLSRGIVPENLPPEEDTKQVEKRLRSSERKLRGNTQGFDALENEQYGCMAPSKEMEQKGK